jgi:hypothetical protein
MKIGTLLPLVSLATIGGLACSSQPSESAESAVSGIPVGELRGVLDTSNTLRTRLFDESDPMTATFDISRVVSAAFRLRRQLGVFAPDGTTTTYQGGQPTPLRMTLWHQVFGRFAAALGDVCETPGTSVTFPEYFVTTGTGSGGGAPTVDSGAPAPPKFRLHPSVAEKIAKVCTFEGDEPARRRAAASYWDALMGRGGSLATEKAAFETAFAADGAPDVTSPPKERVANMTLAMLLNPHFLLVK